MSDYNTLQTRANGLANEAATMNATTDTLPAKLRAAVALRFQNSPMVGARDTALKGVLDEPSQSRAYVADLVKGGTILSPTQQAAIEAGRKSNAVVPLVSANDLLARETGSIGDIAAAGTAAYKASAGLKQSQAELAQKQADSAFDRFIKTSELDLKKSELDLKKADSGGAGTLAQRISLFNALKPNATQEAGAITAQSGLSDIQKLQRTLFDDKGAFTTSGSQILRGSAGGIIAKFLNPKIREYDNAAKNIYDILSRTRTGAALNLSEEQFYKQFVPTATDTASSANDKLVRLQSIFQKEYEAGQNPLSILTGGLSGIGDGGGDWEVVQ